MYAWSSLVHEPMPEDWDGQARRSRQSLGASELRAVNLHKEVRAMIPNQVSTKQGSVSETAYWIAAYRAVESARPDALFVDRFAAKFASLAAQPPPAHVPGWPVVVRTK